MKGLQDISSGGIRTLHSAGVRSMPRKNICSYYLIMYRLAIEENRLTSQLLMSQKITKITQQKLKIINSQIAELQKMVQKEDKGGTK